MAPAGRMRDPRSVTAEQLHALSAEAVAEKLAVDPRRPLPEEAARRLQEVGPNELGGRDRPHYAAVALRQFADPLVLLLVVAAAVSFLIGEQIEAAVIAAIVVLNAVLGFVQEAGAERAVMALRQAVELNAMVVRGGRDVTAGAGARPRRPPPAARGRPRACRRPAPHHELARSRRVGADG